MQLVITEKPSVARSISEVIGAVESKDGYMEGNGYLVSWCVGHLVELAQPESYGEQRKKWTYESLPVKPENWQYEVKAYTKAQYEVLYQLMHREDVPATICATDVG
ncbi:MAG: DNA topoisomerase III [Lachnospiraceae bacterium]|nr:DNA topoisomerase III [Lachnospiraceae bacterium]